MRNIFLVVFAAVFVFSSTPALAGAQRPGAPGGSVATGKTAPDFTLEDMTGKKVTLSKLRGKVVMLNFWATWCPPCQREMPSMERLHEAFAGKDFVMLAVNIEENGKSAVKGFLQRQNYTFPILLDTKADVQNRYGVYRVPETFIIGKDGKILQRIIGAKDWSSVEFMKELSALIEG